MLGLSKPLFPLIYVAVISIVCSYFFNYAWVIPMLIVPFYWMPIDPYERSNNRHQSSLIDSICHSLKMKIPDYYTGKPCRCLGVFRPYIVSEKYSPAVISHEISHIYYKHPFLNAAYFSICCFCAASMVYLVQIWTLLFLFILIPVTNYKTLLMEISADKLADNFSDMREHIIRHTHDSWFKKKRLAALSGKRV